MLTFLTNAAVPIEGTVVDQQLFFAPEALEAATGWTLKDGGLCRGPVCVPLRGIALQREHGIDAKRFAEVLGRRVVVDPERGIAAMAVDPSIRAGALQDKVAPEIVLPDLNGALRSLSELRGSKTLVVTFATWCGCRYDLPGWQALEDELRESGFGVLAIAFDDDPEEVRPFTNGITFPVLLDRHHVVSEAYAMSNVPTVVWIDEDGRVVLPNSEAFGTDLFADFTGVKSGPHLDAVRAWVRAGVLPEVATSVVEDFTESEIDARLHFRIGVELRDQGDLEGASKHFARASELAPFDWTVRRAAMPLTGRDPFGQEFLDLYDEWKANGAPFHGIASVDDVRHLAE